MQFIVGKDETLNPVDISLLGRVGIILEPNRLTNAISKFDLRLQFHDAFPPPCLWVAVRCCKVQKAFAGTLYGASPYNPWFIWIGPV